MAYTVQQLGKEALIFFLQKTPEREREFTEQSKSQETQKNRRVFFFFLGCWYVFTVLEKSEKREPKNQQRNEGD